MKKPDEVAALRALAKVPPYTSGVIQRVFVEHGTHENRVYRLCEKWEDQFGWECGTSLRTGWLPAEGHSKVVAWLVAHDLHAVPPCPAVHRLCANYVESDLGAFTTYTAWREAGGQGEYLDWVDLHDTPKGADTQLVTAFRTYRERANSWLQTELARQLIEGDPL